MILVYKQAGKDQQQVLGGDWEQAAVEARRLIMFRGATNVAIHEEETA